MSYHLSDQTVEDFQRDGAVALPGLFTADEIAMLTEAIEANIAAPSCRLDRTIVCCRSPVAWSHSSGSSAFIYLRSKGGGSCRKGAGG